MKDRFSLFVAAVLALGGLALVGCETDTDAVDIDTDTGQQDTMGTSPRRTGGMSDDTGWLDTGAPGRSGMGSDIGIDAGTNRTGAGTGTGGTGGGAGTGRTGAGGAGGR